MGDPMRYAIFHNMPPEASFPETVETWLIDKRGDERDRPSNLVDYCVAIQFSGRPEIALPIGPYILRLDLDISIRPGDPVEEANATEGTVSAIDPEGNRIALTRRTRYVRIEDLLEVVLVARDTIDEARHRPNLGLDIRLSTVTEDLADVLGERDELLLHLADLTGDLETAQARIEMLENELTTLREAQKDPEPWVKKQLLIGACAIIVALIAGSTSVYATNKASEDRALDRAATTAKPAPDFDAKLERLQATVEHECAQPQALHPAP